MPAGISVEVESNEEAAVTRTISPERGKSGNDQLHFGACGGSSAPYRGSRGLSDVHDQSAGAVVIGIVWLLVAVIVAGTIRLAHSGKRRWCSIG